MSDTDSLDLAPVVLTQGTPSQSVWDLWEALRYHAGRKVGIPLFSAKDRGSEPISSINNVNNGFMSCL